MYSQLFGQMKKQLAQITTWLDAADAHAKAKSFDSALYLGFRLAPDQFAFARQVQITCDTAKKAAAHVAGKEAPTHADTEKTTDDLRARVRSVVTYLEGFTAKDFEGADERTVTQPRWEGKWMTAPDYFVQHALPNFYFHLAQSYAILRHNGVPLGKKDYLGAVTMHAPKS